MKLDVVFDLFIFIRAATIGKMRDTAMLDKIV